MALIWGVRRHLPRCEDPGGVSAETPFTIDEVQALHELFKKISSLVTNDGLIDKEEFQLALFRNQNQRNFFADRLFDLFDCNCDGVIDFDEFVFSLGVFHPDAKFETKVAFAFKLHDLRSSGYIEKNELKQMVFSVLHESDLQLPEDVVEFIVEKSYSEADLKGDGRIDFQEWTQFVSKNPSLIKNMSLPYLKDLTPAFPSFCDV